MIHRRSMLKGIVATVATLVAAVGATKMAAAIEIKGVQRKNGIYTGVHYQAWTPDSHPHVMLIQRFESREAQEFSVVGVALHGGPWRFVSNKEAKTHVQVIWDAALVEAERVYLQHEDGAEKAIALHQTLRLAHDPAEIRREQQARAALQVATYHGHVKDMMKERELQIGKSHPTLAGQMYAMVKGESLLA